MSKAKRVLIVANLHAGTKQVRNKLCDIIDEFCREGYVPTVRTTQCSGDACRIVAGKSESYDLVVCAGGDGTLSETVSGMMLSSRRVPVGYIPCGSTNDMARTLGLSRNMAKATHTILNGTPVTHDIGKFGNDKFFTYIASFGAFTRASYDTPQKIKNAIGHLAYIFEGIRELGEIKPHHFRVTFNGQTVEDDFIFGSVSNTMSAAGFFKFPANDVNLSDGQFEVFLVRDPKTPIGYTDLILRLGRQDFQQKNVIFAHTDNIIFESQKKLPWTIDGECSGKLDRVEISNVTDTIEIIQNKHIAKKIEKAKG